LGLMAAGGQSIPPVLAVLEPPPWGGAHGALTLDDVGDRLREAQEELHKHGLDNVIVRGADPDQTHLAVSMTLRNMSHAVAAYEVAQDALASDYSRRARRELRRELVRCEAALKDEFSQDLWRCAQDLCPTAFPEMDPALPSVVGPSTRLGPLRLRRELGHGAFGVVLAAVHDDTGNEEAVKVVSKQDCCTPAGFIRMRDEVVALRRVAGHPGVVRLLGVMNAPRHVLLRMELAGRSNLLTTIQRAGGRLELPRALRLFGQLVAALAHCHRRGVAHRDLKPENLVVAVAADGERLRLMDFGCAVRVDAPCHDVVGTMPFIAPEVLLLFDGGGPYAPAGADVWAAGVVLLEMLRGVGALSLHLGWPPGAAPAAGRAQELLALTRGADLLAEARLPGSLLVYPPTARIAVQELAAWAQQLDQA